MMFPVIFFTIWLGGMEPQSDPALAASGHTGLSLESPAPASEENAWGKLAAASPVQPLPSPEGAAASSKTPAGVSAQLLSERARFVQLIPEGALVKFEDQDGAVVFRPTQMDNFSHRPGPMEDEVIASAVRGGIAADAGLQKLKLNVECQSGKVRISGVTESTLQAIALIKLALGVNGVERVKVDLPPVLRAAAGPAETVPRRQ